MATVMVATIIMLSLLWGVLTVIAWALEIGVKITEGKDETR